MRTPSDISNDILAVTSNVAEAAEQTLGPELWAATLREMPVPPSLTPIRLGRPCTSVDEMKKIAGLIQVALEEEWGPRLMLTSRCLPDDSVILPPELPDILLIRSAAPTENIPKLPGRVVVVERFCAEAVLRGADIFAVGILHMSDKVQVGDDILVYVDLGPSDDCSNEEVDVGECNDSDIKTTARKAGGSWRPTRGASIKGWLAAGRLRRVIGVGRVEQNRATVFKACPQGVAVRVFWRKGVSCAPPLDEILAKEELKPYNLYCPTLPSTVIAHLLCASDCEAVLDCCAAPGGKCSHVASLLRQSSLVVACELSRRKAKGVRELVDKLGVGTKVVVLCCDSRSSVDTDRQQVLGSEAVRAAVSENCQDGIFEPSSLPPLSFDAVLLDPSCSGLGNRPRLGIGKDDFSQFPQLQRALLHNAVRALRPGGTLIYSTCTVNPAENEEMVAYALAEFSCLQLVRRDPMLGRPGLAGFGLDDKQRKLVQRFGPSSDLVCTGGLFEDAPGFFAACFVRSSA